jgi:serine protease Do
MVKRVTNQLVASGKVQRGWLGVSVQPLSKELAESLGLSDARGAVVSRVYPQSPAASAGLAQNDVIVSYDGTPVEDYHHLQRLSAETEVGRSVTLDIVRKKERKTIALKISEAPESSGPGGRSTP